MKKPSRIVRSILLAIALLCSVDSSFAQKDYTVVPQGSSTLRTAYGRVVYDTLMLVRSESYPLDIYISIFGDATFTLDQNLNRKLDPLYAPGLSKTRIIVSYRSTAAGTTRAWLRVHQTNGYPAGTFTPDTIPLIGIDTTPAPPPPGWYSDRSDLYFGYHFREPDSTFVEVTTVGDAAVDLTAGITGSGFRIVGPVTHTIAGNSAWYFEVEYDTNFPSAEAVLHLSDGQKTIDVRLHGSNMLRIDDSLQLNGIDFGITGYYDTVCRTLTLANHYATAATIDRLYLYRGSSSDFEIHDAPNLPFVLDPGTSRELTVCFTSPFYEGKRTSEDLIVGFKFAGLDSALFKVVELEAGSFHCVDLPQLATFGSVWSSDYFGLGQSETHDVKVRNPRSDTMTISAIEIPGRTSFRLLNPLPLKIPGKDSAYLEFRWDAQGASMQRSRTHVIVDGCGAQQFDLYGHYSIKLQADQSKTLNFSVDVFGDTLTYSFYNDLNGPIRIVSVSLAQGKDVSITDIDPVLPPFKLDSGRLLEVNMRVNASTNSFNDTLIIVTDNAATALRFPVRVNVTSSVSARGSVSTHFVQVSPNPGYANFNIVISKGTAETIEVLDMLGRLVERLGPGAQSWNSSEVPAGSYFIRVTGRDELGNRFIETQRVLRK